jgi:hypothetical protein
MERLEKLVNKHHEENIPLITIDINDENPRVTRAKKCFNSWDKQSSVILVCSMLIVFTGIKFLM